MEEAHKASVLKRKRVHDDKIISVPDKIRDCNIIDKELIYNVPKIMNWNGTFIMQGKLSEIERDLA